MERDDTSHERRGIFYPAEMQLEFISSPRVVKTMSDEDTRVQIPRGFSPASVNAADFPFDCNRTAIAPLQAKAVSNEQSNISLYLCRDR